MPALPSAPSSGSAAGLGSGPALGPGGIKPSLTVAAERVKTNAGLYNLVADMARIVDLLRVEVRDNHIEVGDALRDLRSDIQTLKTLLIERLDGSK